MSMFLTPFSAICRHHIQLSWRSGQTVLAVSFLFITKADSQEELDVLLKTSEEEEKNTLFTPVLLQRFKTCLIPSISLKTFTGLS